MGLPQSRPLFFLAFLTCAGLIGGALFFQHGLGLEPCPLCIVQRVIVITLGIICLLASIHNPGNTGYRIYAGLSALIAGTGIGIASRQVWLQSLPPDQVPECAPPLDVLIDMLPWQELLTVLFTGTGDCAEVQWTFLGLSIPGWSLIAFIGFFCFALFELFRQRSKRMFT
ncbi:disulfide bond formation protein B [Zooshikella harenae]|uniref:Disulfide bond formation protein B n=1 Tax=Zooshikella harenae TaxID=2827238 RepID=A0ABS5ZDH5_9GAMM|nr:disulfide bond formation protein B [Zooshikella harenae]MBU2711883.1 disulfide bond formation protein B [Zooshikella harenae]